MAMSRQDSSNGAGFRRLRKKGHIVCAQEIGSSPAHPQLDSGFPSHLVPQQDSARETLDYGDTASKAKRYPSTAGIGGTAHFEGKQQSPTCPSVVATDASATKSNTTVSSFEDFLSRATPPPPEHDALPIEVWALPKTGQCKSETSSSPPAYIAESDVGGVQGNRVVPQLDVPPVALLRPLSLSFVNGQHGSPSTSQDPGKAHNNRVPFDQWRFGL
ncbi:hypothetical protein QFC19_006709 [Naganishia cerealis]|uniref:Uncharacterized protein n=1 Tax=Naganishia cerealis TaxID=610337 RepID=A0ACC2VEJ7_9TREE|nr:hypothetical protein QFC19_006709 [Naganishia cerealis]